LQGKETHLTCPQKRVKRSLHSAVINLSIGWGRGLSADPTALASLCVEVEGGKVLGRTFRNGEVAAGMDMRISGSSLRVVGGTAPVVPRGYGIGRLFCFGLFFFRSI